MAPKRKAAKQTGRAAAKKTKSKAPAEDHSPPPPQQAQPPASSREARSKARAARIEQQEEEQGKETATTKERAEESSKEPADESSKQPVDESSKKPAGESSKKPAEESSKKPAEESRVKPAEDNSKQATLDVSTHVPEKTPHAPDTAGSTNSDQHVEIIATVAAATTAGQQQHLQRSGIMTVAETVPISPPPPPARAVVQTVASAVSVVKTVAETVPVAAPQNTTEEPAKTIETTAEEGAGAPDVSRGSAPPVVASARTLTQELEEALEPELSAMRSRPEEPIYVPELFADLGDTHHEEQRGQLASDPTAAGVAQEEQQQPALVSEPHDEIDDCFAGWNTEDPHWDDVADSLKQHPPIAGDFAMPPGPLMAPPMAPPTDPNLHMDFANVRLCYLYCKVTLQALNHQAPLVPLYDINNLRDRFLELEHILPSIVSVTEAVMAADGTGTGHTSSIYMTSALDACHHDDVSMKVEAVRRPRGTLYLPWLSHEKLRPGRTGTSPIGPVTYEQNSKGHWTLLIAERPAAGTLQNVDMPRLLYSDSSPRDTPRIQAEQIALGKKAASRMSWFVGPDEAWADDAMWPTPQQESYWQCGVHVVLSAWAHALGLRPRVEGRLHKWMQKPAALVMAAAREGRADWTLLYSFLAGHGFVHATPEAVPFERRFMQTTQCMNLHQVDALYLHASANPTESFHGEFA